MREGSRESVDLGAGGGACCGRNMGMQRVGWWAAGGGV